LGRSPWEHVTTPRCGDEIPVRRDKGAEVKEKGARALREQRDAVTPTLLGVRWRRHPKEKREVPIAEENG